MLRTIRLLVLVSTTMLFISATAFADISSFSNNSYSVNNFSLSDYRVTQEITSLRQTDTMGVILYPYVNRNTLTGSPKYLQAQNTTTSSVELVFWQSIQNSNICDDFKAYVDSFPQGQFLSLAKIRIRQYCDVSDGQETSQATTESLPRVNTTGPQGASQSSNDVDTVVENASENQILGEWVGRYLDNEQQLTTWALRRRDSASGNAQIEAEGYSNGTYFSCKAEIQMTSNSSNSIDYTVLSGNCGQQLPTSGTIVQKKSTYQMKVCCKWSEGGYTIKLKQKK
jgi:hypothetical protein